MDKVAKSIINFINDQPNAAGLCCSIDEYWDSSDGNSVNFLDLCSAVHATPEQVTSAIAYLVDINHAEYLTLGSPDNFTVVGFRLKHLGLHFKEFQRLTSKEKWKERAVGFLFGVLVSVISGIILKLVL